jgi:hypothetical protein
MLIGIGSPPANLVLYCLAAALVSSFPQQARRQQQNKERRPNVREKKGRIKVLIRVEILDDYRGNAPNDGHEKNEKQAQRVRRRH